MDNTCNRPKCYVKIDSDRYIYLSITPISNTYKYLNQKYIQAIIILDLYICIKNVAVHNGFSSKTVDKIKIPFHFKLTKNYTHFLNHRQ